MFLTYSYCSLYLLISSSFNVPSLSCLSSQLGYFSASSRIGSYSISLFVNCSIMFNSIFEKSSSLSPSPDMLPICFSISAKKSSSASATSDWIVSPDSCSRFIVRLIVSAKFGMGASAIGALGAVAALTPGGEVVVGGGVDVAASESSLTRCSNWFCNSGCV